MEKYYQERIDYLDEKYARFCRFAGAMRSVLHTQDVDDALRIKYAREYLSELYADLGWDLDDE